MRSGSKKDVNGGNDKNNKKKITYPIGPEFYSLYEEIGQGVGASVRRALCIPLNLVVAIKILDFERDNCDLKNISREAQIMNLIDHPNVLKSMCSFVSDHSLWVVMPYMDGGSCLHVLKAAYPGGFEEKIIATILQEVLKGLEYLHHHGHIHRDVKAGNILIDSRGCVKLGDFGVSACLFDSGDRQRLRNTFVGTPCWMAPEVMEQLHGYDFKADIWSFGITALELAHGHAPFSKYPPMKVLLMTLQNEPPSLDEEGDKKFSRSFKQMISSCLVKIPSKRPTAKKLLKHYFFRQSRSNDYICRKLFEGMPPLGERIRALKIKEDDMLAQKKMPDGEKEEISQNEYKRGISDWNFNLEDVKYEASMIQDDEVTCDKDMGESSNSLSTLPHDRCSQFHKFSLDHIPEVEETTEENDVADNMPSFPPHVSYGKTIRNGNYSSYSSPPTDHMRYNFSRKCDEDSCVPNIFHHQRNVNSGSITSLSDFFVKSEVPMHDSITQSSNWVDAKRKNDDDHMEEGRWIDRSNNEQKVEEKACARIVQQKGRFKVTSEDVDIDKVVLTTPMMQKSRSVQVINLHHSSLPLLPTDESTSYNPITPSGFLHLSSAQKGMMKSLKLRDRMWTEPAAD